MLCRLDVLGLEDTPTGDQNAVHSEFREQLQRSSEGWYEATLPWKGDHPSLPNNISGSLRLLGSLVQRLQKTGRLAAYDEIIQEQLREGVVEAAEEPAVGREFYIPHKAVVRDNAQTTKMRIVYDASSRANEASPSLNDCLETGPSLQNKLWTVLVRGRFHPVALVADIRKAFLQIRIRVEDRDALRFHWLHDKDPQRVRTLRFTRALFGLAPSPFLLAGVIKHHLDVCRADHPDSVKEIERSLYIDDLVSVEQLREGKAIITEIFRQATFTLHKWNSNEEELELEENQQPEDSLSYAKQQLGVKNGDSGLLGLTWNKRTDEIGVTYPAEASQPTKRGILGKVAKIYDPLGLVSPTVLQGKMLYRDACNEKCAWDAPLPDGLVQRWAKWERSLLERVNVPRTLCTCPRTYRGHRLTHIR